jgi:phenylacetate-CoA ligase
VIRERLYRPLVGAFTGTERIRALLRGGVEAGTGSPTVIRKRQALLANVLRSARSNYSAYARAIPPAALEDPLATLADLPILTKAGLRQLTQEIGRPLHRGEIWNHTGGSTGTPVSFLQDQRYATARRAGKWVFDGFASYEHGQPRLVLWGSRRDVGSGWKRAPKVAKRWAAGEVWFDAFSLDLPTLRKFADALGSGRFQHVLAYAEVAVQVARWMQLQGYPRPGGLVSLMVSAGTLTPSMRAELETFFGCPVYNRYGCREVGDIACSCHASPQLHVLPLQHVVEVVDASGRPLEPGHEGRIVVTSLWNTAMPLIRYETGDRGALTPDTHCPCGLPVSGGLAFVSGRTNDLLTGERGETVHGGRLSGLLYGVPWVQRFQAVQRGGTVRVKLQPYAGTGQSEEIGTVLRRIEDDLSGALGGRRVEVALVEQIATSGSGKHRFIVNLDAHGDPGTS